MPQPYKSRVLLGDALTLRLDQGAVSKRASQTWMIAVKDESDSA